MPVKEHQRTHKIKFSEQDWGELIQLSFEPFEFESEEELTRGQWIALAHMIMGKACRLLNVGEASEELLARGRNLGRIADRIYAKFPSED